MTTPPPEPPSDSELGHYVEMWKQTIAVQQHFNDIEWRIRGLALTALTFAVGAAALAARDPAKISIFGGHIGLPALIIGAGLILWCTFWFVDAIWYHPLLLGAVKHGEALEEELRTRLPKAGLTDAIRASSRVELFKNENSKWKWRKHPKIAVHSRHKLTIFYLAVGLLEAALLVGFLWSGVPRSENETPSFDAPLLTPTPAPPSSS